jgi:hypothetical protein
MVEQGKVGAAILHKHGLIGYDRKLGIVVHARAVFAPADQHQKGWTRCPGVDPADRRSRPAAEKSSNPRKSASLTAKTVFGIVLFARQNDGFHTHHVGFSLEVKVAHDQIRQHAEAAQVL